MTINERLICRTALNRAIACVQLELEAEGKSGVHLYALHPGETFLMHVRSSNALTVFTKGW